VPRRRIVAPKVRVPAPCQPAPGRPVRASSSRAESRGTERPGGRGRVSLDASDDARPEEGALGARPDCRGLSGGGFRESPSETPVPIDAVHERRGLLLHDAHHRGPRDHDRPQVVKRRRVAGLENETAATSRDNGVHLCHDAPNPPIAGDDDLAESGRLRSATSACDSPVFSKVTTIWPGSRLAWRNPNPVGFRRLRPTSEVAMDRLALRWPPV
jgi:hypothetical protein